MHVNSERAREAGGNRVSVGSARAGGREMRADVDLARGWVSRNVAQAGVYGGRQQQHARDAPVGRRGRGEV
jgi:hypothetical protein